MNRKDFVKEIEKEQTKMGIATRSPSTRRIVRQVMVDIAELAQRLDKEEWRDHDAMVNAWRRNGQDL